MKYLKAFFFTISVLLLTACPQDDMQLEEVELQDINYEVIYFNYAADTGNDTSKLEYEIIFTNPNNIDIQGFSRVTLNTDGLVHTAISTNNSPCYTIAANSNCSLTFEAESSHDLGWANNVSLVAIEYNIAD